MRYLSLQTDSRSIINQVSWLGESVTAAATRLKEAWPGNLPRKSNCYYCTEYSLKDSGTAKLVRLESNLLSVGEGPYSHRILHY